MSSAFDKKNCALFHRSLHLQVQALRLCAFASCKIKMKINMLFVSPNAPRQCASRLSYRKCIEIGVHWVAFPLLPLLNSAELIGNTFECGSCLESEIFCCENYLRSSFTVGALLQKHFSKFLVALYNSPHFQVGTY